MQGERHLVTLLPSPFLLLPWLIDRADASVLARDSKSEDVAKPSPDVGDVFLPHPRIGGVNTMVSLIK